MSSSTSLASKKPTNVYIHRQAATPKPCMVCFKLSPHVLVSQTIPEMDFFYICPSHLGDSHFAKRVDVATPPTSTRLPEKVGKEEIERIKLEWERRKAEKESTKGKAKTEEEGKDDGKPNEKDSKQGSIFSSLISSITSSQGGSKPKASENEKTNLGKGGGVRVESPTVANTSNDLSPAAAAASPPTPPLHAKYSLQREFYGMRLREWNNKMVKRKEIELNMPHVPKSALR
ncbi:hypothetical protein IE53DRAFT_387143 [Violaceomyces palustris]|uniref:Uncharacterized protein n=1 Tax=Violaceomyces palustris TaxID=1673888 RepID=A0ACD0NXP3_9BASI|nr:hypothetical protein IE53DRAFT_387143 [Violaceomyces palustris]